MTQICKSKWVIVLFFYKSEVTSECAFFCPKLRNKIFLQKKALNLKKHSFFVLNTSPEKI
ncbi:hypothetical protein AWN65_01915 [Flavobacterium covae]|nr:hypothetical protein AWN65_01915 [Flavobacterium covae]